MNKYLHKLFLCILVGYITTPSTLMAAGCNQSFGWAEQLRTLAESDKMQISISAVESLINNEAFENKVNSIENKVKFAGDMYDICKHIEAEKTIQAYLLVLKKIVSISGSPISPYFDLLTKGSDFVLDQLDQIISRVAPSYFVVNPQWLLEIRLKKSCGFGIFTCFDSNTSKFIDKVEIFKRGAGKYGEEELVDSRVCPEKSPPWECNSLANPASMWIAIPNPLGENPDNPTFDQFYIKITWKISNTTKRTYGSNKIDNQVTILPIFDKKSSSGLNKYIKTPNIRNISVHYNLDKSIVSIIY